MTTYSIKFEICGTADVTTYRRFLTERMRQLESQMGSEEEPAMIHMRKNDVGAIADLIQHTFQPDGTSVARVEEFVRYEVMAPIKDALSEEMSRLDRDSEEFSILWRLRSSLNFQHVVMSSTFR